MGFALTPSTWRNLNIAAGNTFPKNKIYTARLMEFEETLNSIPNGIVRSEENTFSEF